MSLALKSNNIATNYLGNINGIKGKQDWVAFFDFENEEYTTQKNGVRNTLTLAETITNTGAKNMAVKPQTMNKQGVRSYTTASTDIRHWKIGERFGVLIENEQTNWFANSATPATQTISAIPAGSTLVASCIGSGSLVITGTGIDSIVVTEATPKTITPQAQAGVITLSVEVVGTLSHVQVVRCAGFACVHSPITTTASRPNSGNDQLEIKQELLSSLLNTDQPVTILIESVPMYQTHDARTMFNELRAAVETDTLVAGIGLNKTSDVRIASRFVSLIKSDNTTQSSGSGNSQQGALNVASTQVAYLTATGAKLGLNGGEIYSAVAATNLNKLKRLRLAPALATPQVQQGGNCIITKLAIFNRQMSDAEILEYSKSWN